MTATRQTLPTRRPNLTVDAHWQGHPITVTVGYDPATGDLREVFAQAGRGGSMQAVLSDGCVLISIALQSGIGLAALEKSLSREPDPVRGGGATRPASPLGAVIDLMMGVA